MLRAIKDTLACQSIRSRLNRRFSRYGQIERLQLNSRLNRLEAVVTMRGELEPLRITVGHYTLDRTGNKLLLRIDACECSRPWLQHLIEDFACTRSFELPGWLALIL
jgi:hypothetical protein